MCVDPDRRLVVRGVAVDIHHMERVAVLVATRTRELDSPIFGHRDTSARVGHCLYAGLTCRRFRSRPATHQLRALTSASAITATDMPPAEGPVFGRRFDRVPDEGRRVLLGKLDEQVTRRRERLPPAMVRAINPQSACSFDRSRESNVLDCWKRAGEVSHMLHRTMHPLAPAQGWRIRLLQGV